jgi:photosystem II stability/assembly factor-like uncharacterized protein
MAEQKTSPEHSRRKILTSDRLLTKLILSELFLLFLATTFMTDSPPPGWYQQSISIGNKQITDIQFLDSLNGWVVTNWGPAFDTSYIFNSTDGGNSWIFQARYPASFNALSMVNNNLGYAVGGTGNGRIYKTTNGGTNWLLLNVFASTFFDVQFVNKDTGWVCSYLGFGGLYKTTNGGVNWSPQMSSSYYPKKLFFISKDTGWVISDEANGKLYWTTNSGANWNLKYTFTTGVGDVFFVSWDTGWVTGGGGGTGIMKTTNSGSNWFAANNPTPFGDSKLFFKDNKNGWAGSGQSKIVATVDGENWGYQTTPNFTHYNVLFIDTLKGWAGGGGNDIIHSTDGGGPINSTIKISEVVPDNFRLFQNYPNPLNPKTNIKLLIKSNGKSEKSKIKLAVYDIAGKEITILLEQELNAGTYETTFDGANYSSGIYFYTLVADGKLIDTKRMILIK